MLSEKARQLTRIHAQPRFLMTELLRILEIDRIVVPGYSTFQKIMSFRQPRVPNEDAVHMM